MTGRLTIHRSWVRSRWCTTTTHEHEDLVRCTTHVHLDHHNCLEVIVIAGKAAEVRRLAEGLISIRGVKHGELTCTTTGREL